MKSNWQFSSFRPIHFRLFAFVPDPHGMNLGRMRWHPVNYYCPSYIHIIIIICKRRSGSQSGLCDWIGRGRRGRPPTTLGNHIHGVYFYLNQSAIETSLIEEWPIKKWRGHSTDGRVGKWCADVDDAANLLWDAGAKDTSKRIAGHKRGVTTRRRSPILLRLYVLMGICLHFVSERANWQKMGEWPAAPHLLIKFCWRLFCHSLKIADYFHII